MVKTTSEREIEFIRQRIQSINNKNVKETDSIIRMLKKQTHRHREQISRKEEGGSSEIGIGN